MGGQKRVFKVVNEFGMEDVVEIVDVVDVVDVVVEEIEDDNILRNAVACGVNV